MNKLCFTFLTLALGAPALAHAADDKTPPLSDTAAVKTSVAGAASTSATAKIAISDQDALGDDILAVINLPVAAADARDAGVDEVELKAALDVTRDNGLSAGDASEVVAEEAEQTRTRGVKKGFGQWVKMQVAAGLRGTKLAAKIKEHKKDTEALDEKATADLEAKLQKQRELNAQWRAKAVEKRGELLAKGKARVILHKERNDKLKIRLAAAEAKQDDKGTAIDGRLKALDAKIATASDEDKKMLEAERARLVSAQERNDKAGDKLDKAADKAEQAGDKIAEAADKAGDKVEKALDKAADKLEDKAAKLEEKAAKRDAKAQAKVDAKADAKAGVNPTPAPAQ